MRQLSTLAACFCVVSVLACHQFSSAERKQANFRIPRDAARFSISVTTDSTVTFRPLEATWLRPGMRAHAVDPTQRDALIARLTIQRFDSAGIIAKIDGSVAQVSTTHVVLVVRPPLAWWKDRRFWNGVGAGVLIGAFGAVTAK